MLSMRRLLLTLLLFCLAFPAVAVEECAVPAGPAPEAAMAMHGHHAPPAPADEKRDSGKAAQHGCIGCVPPLGAAPASLEPMPPAVTYTGEPATLDLAPPYGPTPPPPRFPA